MKLTALEAFCASVEERSMSAAARRLFLSQPSLSERIGELEREAGVPLLARSPRGVECTPEGTAFYERARSMLHEFKALEVDLHDLGGPAHRTVRFGACYTLGESLVLEWLRAYRAQAGEVTIELILGNNPQVVEHLRSGRIALGVVAREGDLDRLRAIPLFTEELVVVVPPDHAWAERRVEPHELHAQAFIARERGSTTRQVVDEAVRDAGLEPLAPAMELGSTTAIKEALEAGFGFSVLSRSAIERELRAGVLTAVDGFGVSREFVIVERRGSSLTTSERSLREHLCAFADSAGA